MRTNNNNLVDFSSKQTYVASESLLQEAKDKHSDIYHYTETKYNIIADTVQQYINDNGLDNELYDIVCEWLAENSHIEPNF